MPALQNIRARLGDLTSKQRSIAQFILSAPEEVSYMPLKELAHRAGASEVSVLRLCHALGYDSFVALKEALRAHMLEALQSRAPRPLLGPAGERAPGGREEKLCAICEDDRRNLAEMTASLEAERIFSCARGVLAADEVLVFAHDGTKIFADYLCYRLNFLRVKASSIKLGDSDTMQSVLARLKKTDYVILLSFPPYHLPVFNVASFCRRRGTPILAITDSLESPAAAEDVEVFLCKTAARYFYNSQVATAAFINIFTSCIAVEMGARFDEILLEEQDVSDFMSAGQGTQAGK